MKKYMQLTDMGDDQLLNIVYDYADDNFEFDLTFIESLSSWLEDNDELTQKQRDSVIHIIESHHMEY